MRNKICSRNIEGLQVKKIMRSLDIEYVKKMTMNSGECERIFSSSTIIKWSNFNLIVDISELFQENILEIMLNI